MQLVDSLIGECCTIGSDTRVVSSTLKNHSRLDRRNWVTDSVVGSGSYTGANCVVRDADIGNFCCISWNVSIGGMNHDYSCGSMMHANRWKSEFGADVEDKLPRTRCRIGSDVWIGACAVIQTGVALGHGCVMGGGVVIRDVPPYAIVAGVPAKIKGYRFDEQTIGRLLEAAWWNLRWDDVGEMASILSKPIDEKILNSIERECAARI